MLLGPCWPDSRGVGIWTKRDGMHSHAVLYDRAMFHICGVHAPREGAHGRGLQRPLCGLVQQRSEWRGAAAEAGQRARSVLHRGVLHWAVALPANSIQWRTFRAQRARLPSPRMIWMSAAGLRDRLAAPGSPMTLGGSSSSEREGTTVAAWSPSPTSSGCGRSCKQPDCFRPDTRPLCTVCRACTASRNVVGHRPSACVLRPCTASTEMFTSPSQTSPARCRAPSTDGCLRPGPASSASARPSL